MRAEKLVSFAAVFSLVIWTVAADQFLTRGAKGATGLLVIKAVSGDDLAGSADCDNIASNDYPNCPDAYKGAGCTRTRGKCHGATTGQTNTATCSAGTVEICQDTAGKCAAGYSDTYSSGGCTQNTVPE